MNRSFSRACFAFVLLFLFKTTNTQNSCLTSLFAQKEQLAVSLAYVTSTLHSNQRCSFNCSCSYSDCSSTLAEFVCDYERGVDPLCGCAGRKLSLTKSVVSFPPSAGTLSAPTDIFKTTECWSQGLDPHFRQALLTDPKLTWVYFASTTGFLRLLPGVASEECLTYTPHTQPWFISAISGPKNIIVVLDASSRASQRSIPIYLTETLKQILETLVISDHIGVVLFGSTGYSLGGRTTMVQATEQNIEAIISDYNNTEKWGVSNYSDAFRAAFELLHNSIDQQIYTGCTTSTAILFVSASDLGFDGISGMELTSYIREMNRFYVPIFTYTLDFFSQDLKMIACDSDGFFSSIELTAEILVSNPIPQYYLYFATVNDAIYSSVVWSEPYEDESGAGMLTTASLAVYEGSILIGVIAVDLQVSELVACTENYNNFLVFLTQKKVSCARKAPITSCQLENARSTMFYSTTADSSRRCTTTSCGFTGNILTPCSFPNSQPLCSESAGYTYKNEACCDCPQTAGSLSTGAIVGIAVGSSLTVILIIIIAVVVIVNPGSSGKGTIGAGSTPSTSPTHNANDGHDSWSADDP